jgi:hypothetical protein
VTIQNILSRLAGVRRTSSGFRARCPAHDDKCPSLSVREGHHGILIRCWAGCELQSVVDALGLRVSDLFYDAVPTSPRQVVIRRVHVDRIRIAFNFDMAAVNYRVQSSSFFEELEYLDFSRLAETDQDRLIDQAGVAHSKLESAERLERLADDLRLTAFNSHDRRAACRRNRVA